MTAVETDVVRIFLLDDTRELRVRVRGALTEDEDLRVVGEADDPVDGLPLIEDLQPDVVVCDLSMPRMDGLEAIPRIVACAPDAGIVVFSGLLGEALGETALNLGADRYVEKSAPLGELASAVRAVAASRRSGVRPEPASTAPPPPTAPPPQRAPDPEAVEGDALMNFVSTVGALTPLRLYLLTAAVFGIAAGLSLLIDLIPSTFLVLWLTPVIVLGARVPARAAAVAVVVGSGLYAYCAWHAGAKTWYGAAFGVTLCMVTLAVVGERMTSWMRRRVGEQEALTHELQRSNAELEHFAYVASHDLAAPLRTVSSFATMVQTRYEDKLDAEGEKMLGFITGGTRRMQRMIDDLLVFARAGRVDAAREPFDLAAVVSDVQGDLAAQLAERDAVLNVGQLPRLVGDQARIGQVMLNLLTNALKFCPPDRAPVIDVSATRLRAGWRIDVRDNGIGIDPRYASKVFGMFQRLHTDEQFPGTGIGLAICQRIIERHGGRIWVDGFEGDGSTFSVTIPDPV